ncbi:MAG: acyltransferase family protein [Clostridia bacterium]|nr:acyltransferase family protein [Clostridia bacterium]
MSGVRKRYIDFIKAFGIILVIMGHVNFANGAIKAWIYLFHMPIFFFSAGLVISKRLCKDFFIKRFWTLIVPYAVWGLIYAQLTIPNIVKIAYGSYHTIDSASSLSSLWFLPVMFLSSIFVQIILKMTDKKMAILVLGGVSFLIGIALPKNQVGYPWCVDVAFIAVFFIVIGYVSKDKLEALSGKVLSVVFVVGLLATIIVLNIPNISEDYVLLATRRIGNPLSFVIGALGGCIMVYSIARLVDSLTAHTNLLSYVGKNSLIILLVHKPIIWGMERVFNIVKLVPVVELIVTTIVALTCSSIMAWVINMYFPNLIGKNIHHL